MEDGIDESFTQGFSGSHVVGFIGRGGGMSQGWGEGGGEWWSASSGGAFGLRYRAGGWAGGLRGHIRGEPSIAERPLIRSAGA